MFSWNLFVDIVFLSDWVKNFFTGEGKCLRAHSWTLHTHHHVAHRAPPGYINADQVVVMDKKRVVKNYLRTWCFLDLISSIPIAAIIRWSGMENDGAASDAKVRYPRAGRTLTRTHPTLPMMRPRHYPCHTTSECQVVQDVAADAPH